MFSFSWRPELTWLADSKYLSEPEREALFEAIVAHPGIEYGVGIMDNSVVDKVNILEATMRAMTAATAQLIAGTKAGGCAGKAALLVHSAAGAVRFRCALAWRCRLGRVLSWACSLG